jgi:hypothetical protein
MRFGEIIDYEIYDWMDMGLGGVYYSGRVDIKG